MSRERQDTDLLSRRDFIQKSAAIGMLSRPERAPSGAMRLAARS
jgi:hypothetical protein